MMKKLLFRRQSATNHGHSSPDVLGVVDHEHDDDHDDESGEESLSYLEGDGVDRAVDIESSSGSRSVYDNTPSFNPLVGAFHGAQSLTNIMVTIENIPMILHHFGQHRVIKYDAESKQSDLDRQPYSSKEIVL